MSRRRPQPQPPRPLTTTHDCPGGCGTPVPHHQFACRVCWIRLPPGYRTDIQTTYQRDHHEHAQAMIRAMVWYREHPRHQGRETTME